jgi:hypothetical protein
MNALAKVLAAGTAIAGASYATWVASTWLRYGRPRKARGEAADPILDALMPAYDVCERHRIAVGAPAEVTLAAAKDFDPNDARLVRAIFRARELILRSKSEVTARPRGMFEGMKAIGWGVLADSPHEIVMGAVTRPWESDPVFRPLPPGEFTAFAEPDFVKIAWTLRADQRPDGSSVFRTETRAVATDAGAAGKFRLYWAFLSPGIILIRTAMLPAVKAEAERRWRLEGDDVVADAAAQLTHAVTIDAPPKDVWPWLLQMGCQRAGWYSWDLLDNAGVPSADHIIPELQTIRVGDVLPARPEGAIGFRVSRIVPERALVLDGLSPDWRGTWAFVLEPVGADKTRLVTRYRAAYPPSVKMAIMLPALRAVHGFMQRKQLRTIKHHAEHLHAAA